MDALLTTAEAAAHLRCCTKTLRAYVKAGELVPVQLGRRFRFRVEDVDAFVSARRRVSVVRSPDTWHVKTGVGRLRSRSA